MKNRFLFILCVIILGTFSWSTPARAQCPPGSCDESTLELPVTMEPDLFDTDPLKRCYQGYTDLMKWLRGVAPDEFTECGTTPGCYTCDCVAEVNWSLQQLADAIYQGYLNCLADHPEY